MARNVSEAPTPRDPRHADPPPVPEIPRESTFSGSLRDRLVLLLTLLLALGSTPSCIDSDADSSVGSSTPTTRTPNITLSLAPSQQQTIQIEVPLPDPEAGELGADVMVLFDRSGSFGDDLDTFRMEAGRIVDALTLRFPDLRIGLASFVDAPCLSFGSPSFGTGFPGDFGYELNLSLPDSAAAGVATAFRDALDALDIRGGNDGPESQLEAIRQALTGDGLIVDPNVSPDCSPVADIPATSPGFRMDRVRFLIVSTDASFHRPDPDDPGYPYPTDVQDAIDVALETGTTIFFLDSGFTDAAADDIAAATGGAVFVLGSASQEVVSAIADAIDFSLSQVELRLEPSAGGAGFVADIAPPFQIVDLLVDRTAFFDVTFEGAAAAAADDTTYDFDLVISADGAELDRLVVAVTVPGTAP